MITENDLSKRMERIQDFLDTKNDVYLKMLESTRKKIGVYFGSGFSKTCKAEVILHEVIGDLIDGTRDWDMDKYKLEQVLWMNIKSELSNLAKKEKRFVSAGNPVNGENEESNSDFDSLINTPAADVAGSIDADAIENYCTDVILKDDIDAQIVFNEMLTGKTQKQIAEDLGLTVRESESIIRKIRRNISNHIPFHLLENLPVDLKDKIINYNK